MPSLTLAPKEQALIESSEAVTEDVQIVKSGSKVVASPSGQSGQSLDNRGLEVFRSQKNGRATSRSLSSSLMKY